jgi:gamma-glutamylcysteine synthetase
VAREGRKPGLLLSRNGRQVPLKGWALEIIDSMRGVCEMLDEGDAQRPYSTALEVQEAKVRDVSLTPAARTMDELRTNQESFSTSRCACRRCTSLTSGNCIAPVRRGRKSSSTRQRNHSSSRNVSKHPTGSRSTNTSSTIFRHESIDRFAVE